MYSTDSDEYTLTRVRSRHSHLRFVQFVETDWNPVVFSTGLAPVHAQAAAARGDWLYRVVVGAEAAVKMLRAPVQEIEQLKLD